MQLIADYFGESRANLPRSWGGRNTPKLTTPKDVDSATAWNHRLFRILVSRR